MSVLISLFFYKGMIRMNIKRNSLITNREIPTGKTKIPVGLSFSGLKGHIAKEILDEAKEKDGIDKSKLVVELLLIYGEAKKKYGSDSIQEMMRKTMGW